MDRFWGVALSECPADARTEPLATHKRREIDERDIDLLLAALTDGQIAETFGWSEAEVEQLRRSRRAPPHTEAD